MKWQALIDEREIRGLLSKDYAHFAPPICEALAIFLAGLPRAAQRAILARQAELPGATGFSERLGQLARQCPVLHKLGQSLARDRRLNPELRRELCKLETLPCSVPPEALRDTLERELGSLDHLGVKLDQQPIAEASVAVVIGYRDTTRSGVFKVLKPGIEERLELELELLERVGRRLDERCTELGIPRLDYEEAFQQINIKLRDEVRLVVEQRNLGLAAEQYTHCGRVKVPALHEYCARRVTAMERVTGRKVTDHGLREEHERRRLASLLASSLLARPVFSTRDEALFHGDPHAGNLIFTPEGRLGILDWSLAGRLRQRDREAIVHILLGAMMFDERRAVEMLETFAEGPRPDRERLLSVVRGHMGRIGYGQLPDFHWLVGLIDDVVERTGLRTSGDLLLFRKSLHTLYGVVTEVGAGEGAIDQAVYSEFAHHFAAEWPRRWLAALDSRAYPTRLSNADLTRLMWSWPAVAAHFWVASAGRAYS